jgi:hypothetical protein
LPGDAALDGGVFRGHAEGVPAHGVEDIEAPHALVPGDYVADGVIAHVAHVDLTGRVGEHLQKIILLPVLILRDFKDPLVVPVFLPFFFYFPGSVFPAHRFLSLHKFYIRTDPVCSCR